MLRLSLCSQKLTPVLPWEVDRVKPFLATLVDDLIDRAKVPYLRVELMIIATGIGYLATVVYDAKKKPPAPSPVDLQLSRTTVAIRKTGPPWLFIPHIILCCLARSSPHHQEELAERNRRPTKLCIEHYLHQRGSKSQTFVLPASTPSRPRHSSAPAAGDPPEAAVAGRQSEAVASPELGGQEKSGDILALPPATVLVELALTPFKKYRQSHKAADGGGLHGGAAARPGGDGAVGAGEMPRRRDILPPVVKLIVSLLAFETVGPAPPTAAPPGQRTLRDMMWLKKPTPTTTAASAKGPNGEAGPLPSGTDVSGEPAAATAASSSVPEVVAPSPVARVAPAGSPSSITDHAAARPKTGETAPGSRISIPRKVEEAGSVLVRCPRCKACLPVGEAWDVHREEHLLEATASDHREPAGVRRSGPATQRQQEGPSSPRCLPTMPPQHRPSSSPELVAAATEMRRTSVSGDAGGFGGGSVDIGDGVRPSGAEVRAPVEGAAGGSSDGDTGRRRSRKLSQLLMMAVTPEQAADVLGDRGFLRDDGQTRFANLGLLGDDLPGALQEETSLNE